MVASVYKKPFKVLSGDGWAQAFRVTVQPDPDVDETEPEDLSAYTDWASQWRPTAASTDDPITLTVDASDGVNGVIVVRATGEQAAEMGTAAVPAGVFDIQAIGTDGEPRTFVRAKTAWELDVTRV